MIKNIGKHRIRHGDVMNVPAICHELMCGGPAHIMYSDPPWGTGNIKYWATMNKKMTGQQNIPAGLDEFLSAIFSIAKACVTDYLLIEYGERWAADIVERGIKAGFSHRLTVKIAYRGGKSSVNGGLLPMDLHVFTKGSQPIPAEYERSVQGTYGFDCIKKAFYPLAEVLKAKYAPTNEPIVALDPCCGMGYTAQCAVNTGLDFRGNELNSKRLQKTIVRLEKSVK